MRMRPVALFAWLFLPLLHGGCAPSRPAPLPPAPASPPPVTVTVRPPTPAATKAEAASPVTFVLEGDDDTGAELYSLVSKRLTAPSYRFTLPPGAGVSPALTAHLGNVSGPVVAIGLAAARAVAPLAANRDVLFALAFNIYEHRLLERGAIGISMLPDPRTTLQLLRELALPVNRLAIATGSKGDGYLALIEAEAKRLGITLVAREIASDKELLLFATQLGPAVGATWILPDNRIISREMVRQTLALHVKSGRAAIVFAPDLLKYGGLISARFDLAAIAEQLLQTLALPRTERGRLRGLLLQPAGAHLAINGELVRALGLSVPARHAHLVQTP